MLRYSNVVAFVLAAAFAGLCSHASASDTTTLPPVNPWLAKSSYPVSHHNAAQTDSTLVNGPTRGKQLTLDDAKSVPLLWCSAPTYKHIGDDTK